jgi:hypothetical protein
VGKKTATAGGYETANERSSESRRRLPHIPVLLLETKDQVRIARVSISCKRECAVWNIQWEVQFGEIKTRGHRCWWCAAIVVILCTSRQFAKLVLT